MVLVAVVVVVVVENQAWLMREGNMTDVCLRTRHELSRSVSALESGPVGQPK